MKMSVNGFSLNLRTRQLLIYVYVQIIGPVGIICVWMASCTERVPLPPSREKFLFFNAYPFHGGKEQSLLASRLSSPILSPLWQAGRHTWVRAGWMLIMQDAA